MDVSNNFNSAASVKVLTPEQAFPDGSVSSFGLSDNFWAKAGDFVNPYKHEMEQKWEAYKLANDREYELAKINDARAWEYYLNSNKYSMAVDDLKRAGLNPWLAVQSGLSGSNSGSSTSASASSSATSHRKDSNDSRSYKLKDFVSSALKIAGFLALVG